MTSNQKDNLGSFARLAAGYAAGYFRGKGIDVDAEWLAQAILAVATAAPVVWAWWHNRPGATGTLSH